MHTYFRSVTIYVCIMTNATFEYLFHKSYPWLHNCIILLRKLILFSTLHICAKECYIGYRNKESNQKKIPFGWLLYVMVHSLEWGIMGFKGKTIDYLPQLSVCGRIFVFIIRLARIRVDGSFLIFSYKLLSGKIFPSIQQFQQICSLQASQTNKSSAALVSEIE